MLLRVTAVCNNIKVKRIMSKSDNSTPEFTGLRARLWPIHAHELKKFIPLGIIMFCLLFNYTILRDTKDSLVVNSAGSVKYMTSLTVTSP